MRWHSDDSCKDTVQEELKYLKKWAQELEAEPLQFENYQKLQAVIYRLKKSLRATTY